MNVWSLNHMPNFAYKQEKERERRKRKSQVVFPVGSKKGLAVVPSLAMPKSVVGPYWASRYTVGHGVYGAQPRVGHTESSGGAHYLGEPPNEDHNCCWYFKKTKQHIDSWAASANTTFRQLLGLLIHIRDK